MTIRNSQKSGDRFRVYKEQKKLDYPGKLGDPIFNNCYGIVAFFGVGDAEELCTLCCQFVYVVCIWFLPFYSLVVFPIILSPFEPSFPF